MTAPTHDPRPAVVETDERAGKTLAAAVDALWSLQHPEGYWKGELETNASMDAEDLLLRQFLGIRTEE